MKAYQRFTENGKTFVVIAIKRNGKIRVREVLADGSYGPSIEREVPAHMVLDDLAT